MNNPKTYISTHRNHWQWVGSNSPKKTLNSFTHCKLWNLITHMKVKQLISTLINFLYLITQISESYQHALLPIPEQNRSHIVFLFDCEGRVSSHTKDSWTPIQIPNTKVSYRQEKLFKTPWETEPLKRSLFSLSPEIGLSNQYWRSNVSHTINNMSLFPRTLPLNSVSSLSYENIRTGLPRVKKKLILSILYTKAYGGVSLIITSKA